MTIEDVAFFRDDWDWAHAEFQDDGGILILPSKECLDKASDVLDELDRLTLELDSEEAALEKLFEQDGGSK